MKHCYHKFHNLYTKLLRVTQVQSNLY